jgi:hypothetical protein
MPLLEKCLAVYNNRGTLRAATYHVIDFANIIYELKDWFKFVDKVLSIPESDVVVVVGKPITVDGELYDARNLYKTRAAPRLGKNIFVYVITYKSSIASNIDDVLFWFIIYCVFLSKNTVRIYTLDAQPLDKDSTYLSKSNFKIYEVTPKGAVQRLQTERACAKIIKMVMHTTPPYNLEKTVPGLVKTLTQNPDTSYLQIKKTRRRLPRPIYFFAYIKYIQSVVGISKL